MTELEIVWTVVALLFALFCHVHGYLRGERDARNRYAAPRPARKDDL